MRCLWFTVPVTSPRVTIIRLEQKRLWTTPEFETGFGVSNVIWIPTHGLQTVLSSNWRLRTEPTFTQIPTRKVMRSTSRHTSTIEDGDVCSSCCNQMACEDLVLPWYLSGRGAENAMKTQAQIPLVPGNNLGKCDRWRAFKKEPDFVKEQTCLGKTYKWAAWPSSYHSRPVRFQDHVLFAIQVK